MRDKGHTYERIGLVLGLTKSAVNKYVKRWENWEDENIHISGFTLPKKKHILSEEKGTKS
jgi:predicted transcriptional regulator